MAASPGVLVIAPVSVPNIDNIFNFKNIQELKKLQKAWHPLPLFEEFPGRLQHFFQYHIDLKLECLPGSPNRLPGLCSQGQSAAIAEQSATTVGNGIVETIGFPLTF